uniref:Aminopeptidase n=1 Tax=Cyclopterus lumpus TaxID=8103 RepID=A0A8C2Z2E4_CYCLU
MAKESGISKILAGTFVFLTISVIAGIVTMIIFYKTEIALMDPTPRPMFTSSTTSLPPVIRLPKNLVPQSYQVVNVTSPNQTMLFTGNSTVTFHCVQGTSVVYLHSRNLDVSGPVVMNKDTNERIGVSSMKNEEDTRNFLEIQLNAALEAGGNYSLFLAFNGEITENLNGVFVSTYAQGSPAFLAATNLEPADARTVFPCFDEPEMKAVFHVTIIHRRDTVALGNADMRGEIHSNILDDVWKVTYFYPTPKMSTYLFAFTVSEFTDSNVLCALCYRCVLPTQTYARPDAIAAGHAKYAANITGKILKFYENYFGINYEQKTLDQIALPDLGVGAMENWGLITYQEGGLLYEDGVSSLLHKEVIATLIAHELAHQWFGNLVTMKWWNDIWLNEGFATYLSFFAVAHMEPYSKMKDSYFMSNLHAAFEVDALASSHPLSPPQEDVQMTFEIEDMFDAITYCKVQSNETRNEYIYDVGVCMYLSDFSYKNTDQNDLWEYIQKAEDEDGGHTTVAKVMNTWTKQMGYPVITINTTNGEVYQKQFLFNDSSESSLWWYIPIRVMSNAAEPSLVWLESIKKDEFIAKSGEWILANVNCAGYYRVNYNRENWERLSTQLETDPHRIPLMNRGQLVDDAFNLARAKLIEVTLALNSTRFLQNERALLPWESTVRNLEYFVLMFDRSEVYGPMQACGMKASFCLHSQILAIDVACSNALPECSAMATKMFANWMDNNRTNRIHPNLRSVIYCQAVAAGGAKEWEFAWDKFQSSIDTSEKDQLREALSCTKKIWLLNRYLKYTLNPEKIRLMDVGSTILSIADNVAGQALAWNFIRAHWEYVSNGGAASLIEGVTRRFSTQFELEELERFAADNNLSPTKYLQQAVEQTQVNIVWVSENKDSVLKWFENETAS